MAMKAGMLWYSAADIPIKKKIEEAAAYYEHKYGQVCDVCLVHPDALSVGVELPEGIAVQPWRSMLHNHFWLGMDERDGV